MMADKREKELRKVDDLEFLCSSMWGPGYAFINPRVTDAPSFFLDNNFLSLHMKACIIIKSFLAAITLACDMLQDSETIMLLQLT